MRLCKSRTLLYENLTREQVKSITKLLEFLTNWTDTNYVSFIGYEDKLTFGMSKIRLSCGYYHYVGLTDEIILRLLRDKYINGGHIIRIMIGPSKYKLYYRPN
jgi:hypothetical protein